MSEGSKIEIAKMTMQYLMAVQSKDHQDVVARIAATVPTEEAKNANFGDLYDIVFHVIAQSIGQGKEQRSLSVSQQKNLFHHY